MLKIHSSGSTQAGSSLIEILVTIVILAFGLLGLAGFLMQVQTTEWESYQRAQALNLLNDMVERININKAVAANYVTTSPMGTGDTGPADCSTLAIGAPRDLCEWSNKLKGSAEVKAGANIGAMEGARGCITLVQAPNPTAGLCLPGIYQVSVAWQGRNQTVAPKASLGCGKDLYGDDKARRVIAQAVSVAMLTCN
ncbi:MAG: type IV pilus modification protein PilV [Polaromonas sp.]|nr:type IV pilus modification protein PilV [Polaromonas sp.]